jgi:mannose-6-phosphate isomerase-like protein (cupin superfamily)
MNIDMNTSHHFSDGLYAKETHIPANHWLIQHAHSYDHLSILVKGSVELTVDNKTSVIHAPACINICANTHHGVKSLTDVVWYCIHATDCTDVNQIDDVLTAPVNHEKVAELAISLNKGEMTCLG